MIDYEESGKEVTNCTFCPFNSGVKSTVKESNPFPYSKHKTQSCSKVI